MPTAMLNREVIPSRLLTPEEVTFYREEGYLIIRGLMTPETSALLRDDVMEAVRGVPSGFEFGCVYQ